MAQQKEDSSSPVAQGNIMKINSYGLSSRAIISGVNVSMTAPALSTDRLNFGLMPKFTYGIMGPR